jgi:hypothetical protein
MARVRYLRASAGQVSVPTDSRRETMHGVPAAPSGIDNHLPGQSEPVAAISSQARGGGATVRP